MQRRKVLPAGREKVAMGMALKKAQKIGERRKATDQKAQRFEGRQNKRRAYHLGLLYDGGEQKIRQSGKDLGLS